MDVLFYLTELLQTHKTIGIVGLGTFYKKKSPGKYSAEQHAFVPPSYSLHFTSDVNNEDELINFIVEKENIAIESAKREIDDFVEKINAQLINTHQANLEKLGKFLFINNEFTFVADEGNNFGNEFYGLPTLKEITENTQEANDANVKLNLIEEENKIEEENPGSEVVEKENQDSQPVSEKIDLGYVDIKKPQLIGKPFTPNYEYEDDDSEGMLSRPVKIALRIVLVITIIAGVLGLAYFFQPEYFDSKFKNNDSIPVIEPPSKSIDTTSKPLDTLQNQTSIPTKLDSSLVLAQHYENIDSSLTTYEVIGSAEKSQKRINQVINTMKKRGIEAKALQNVPGKLVKISLGSFVDFKAAKKYQDSLKKKLKNPEIYIQTIKPKK